jgi:hypothetical protein
MLLFHWIGTRRLKEWDSGKPPWPAKIAGVTSLSLWILIVASGRWVGFTT